MSTTKKNMTKEAEGKESFADILGEDNLSDEDKRLQEELLLLVERAQDVDSGVRAAAVTALNDAVRSATGSMTSVPKPLKFLSSQYETLKAAYKNYPQPALADLLSWLGMTLGADKRDALRYKLEGTPDALVSWGHEYVRHLAMEVGLAHNEAPEEHPPGATVLTPAQESALLDELVPYLMTHHAEHEAVDLLLEVDALDRILPLVNEENVGKVALYLQSCAAYLPEPDDEAALRTVLAAYDQTGRRAEQLRIALLLGDDAEVRRVYEAAGEDPKGGEALKAQLALILASHGHYGLLEHETDETRLELLGNVRRSLWFQTVLAKDLDVLDPKLPEEIYKEDITGDKTTRRRGPPSSHPIKTDSGRQNLASTFVNAFVNAGYSKDKLLTESGGGEWLFKNREHGRISAAASVGLICLWDPDTGANEVDKYSYTKDEYVKAGVMLGMALSSVNVRTSFNVAFAFMGEHLADPSPLVQQCTAFGLGLAYAGTSAQPEVREALVAAFERATGVEQQAHAAIALGMTHLGSGEPELTELLLTALLEHTSSPSALDSPFTRLLILGLGLLYLGRQERAQVAVEAVKVLPGAWSRYAMLTVDACAYAGSGNVLKVQQLLAVCGERTEESAAFPLAAAVIGLAVVAMREEIGRHMLVRTLDHLLQYGEPPVRRAVPLALAFLHCSDPDLSVMDTLSKLSHEHDAEVAQAAILGLGLLGAGTNHSRIAALLRSLAQYYSKEPTHLFLVRLAQGLLHLGKGTLTIAPLHSDRQLVRPAALAGLLVVLHTCLDLPRLLLGRGHYLLYALAPALAPRWLLTLNEQLEPLPVPVRVGTAVDVVGKAGTPKSITGFQTHTTPVLLGVQERAELATDEWIPLTPVLEGIVILRPNPNARKKR